MEIKKIRDKMLSLQVAVESKRFKTRAAIAAGAVATIGTIAPGFCSGSVTSGMQKVIDAGLGLLMAVGIILAAVGIGQIVMQVLGGLRGEGVMQMNKIATGLGFVAAGLVLTFLKTILTTLGVNLTVNIGGL